MQSALSIIILIALLIPFLFQSLGMKMGQNQPAAEPSSSHLLPIKKERKHSSDFVELETKKQDKLARHPRHKGRCKFRDRQQTNEEIEIRCQKKGKYGNKPCGRSRKWHRFQDQNEWLPPIIPELDNPIPNINNNYISNSSTAKLSSSKAREKIITNINGTISLTDVTYNNQSNTDGKILLDNMKIFEHGDLQRPKREVKTNEGEFGSGIGMDQVGMTPEVSIDNTKTILNEASPDNNIYIVLSTEREVKQTDLSTEGPTATMPSVTEATLNRGTTNGPLESHVPVDNSVQADTTLVTDQVQQEIDTGSTSVGDQQNKATTQEQLSQSDEAFTVVVSDFTKESLVQTDESTTVVNSDTTQEPEIQTDGTTAAAIISDTTQKPQIQTDEATSAVISDTTQEPQIQGDEATTQSGIFSNFTFGKTDIVDLSTEGNVMITEGTTAEGKSASESSSANGITNIEASTSLAAAETTRSGEKSSTLTSTLTTIQVATTRPNVAWAPMPCTANNDCSASGKECKEVAWTVPDVKACMCPVGKSALPGGNCITVELPANESKSELIWDQSNSLIRVKLNEFENPSSGKVITPRQGTEDIIESFAINCVDGRMFIAYKNSADLYMTFVNKLDKEFKKIGSRDLGHFEAPTIDFLTSNFYIVDDRNGRIFLGQATRFPPRTGLENATWIKYKKIISSRATDNVKNIALDLKHGQIFWSNWRLDNGRGAIHVANLDGTNAITLLSDPYNSNDSEIFRPFGIRYDYRTESLFFVESGNYRIEKYGRNSRSVVFQDTSSDERRRRFSLRDIELYGDYLYVSAQQRGKKVNHAPVVKYGPLSSDQPKMKSRNPVAGAPGISSDSLVIFSGENVCPKVLNVCENGGGCNPSTQFCISGGEGRRGRCVCADFAVKLQKDVVSDGEPEYSENCVDRDI